MHSTRPATLLLTALLTIVSSFASAGEVPQPPVQSPTPMLPEGAKPSGVLLGEPAILKALREVTEARAALHANTAASVRPALERAASTLGTVTDDVPTSLALDRIWIARAQLQYENGAKTMTNLALVEDALDRIPQKPLAQEAVRMLGEARRAATEDDQDAVAERLESLAALLSHSQQGSPLESSVRDLSAASRALDQGDAPRADTLLAAVEAKLEVLGLSVPAGPITGTAETAPGVDTDAQVARYALRSAERLLENAAAHTRGSVQLNVEALAREVRAVEHHLNPGTPHERGLHHLWLRTIALADHGRFRAQALWEHLFATSPWADALVDARLYLRLAASDRALSPSRYREEVALARHHLLDAKRLAPGPVAARVGELEQGLDDWLAHPQNNNSKSLDEAFHAQIKSGSHAL